MSRRPWAAALWLTLLAVLFGALACGPEQAAPESETVEAAQEFVWPDGSGTRVEVEIGGRGVITLALYPEMAPGTVENFVKLAREGFYDGTTFHRVIPDFMIQGGDPKTKDTNPKNDGEGGPGYRIDDEINGATHIRGVLSMANTGRANSGGSQFFILHQDSTHLDGRHTIFGRVVDGMQIVDAIAAVETDEFGRWGPKHRPIENQVLVRVTVRDGGSAEGVADAQAAEDGVDAG